MKVARRSRAANTRWILLWLTRPVTCRKILHTAFATKTPYVTYITVKRCWDWFHQRKAGYSQPSAREASQRDGQKKFGQTLPDIAYVCAYTERMVRKSNWVIWKRLYKKLLLRCRYHIYCNAINWKNNKKKTTALSSLNTWSMQR